MVNSEGPLENHPCFWTWKTGCSGKGRRSKMAGMAALESGLNSVSDLLTIGYEMSRFLSLGFLIYKLG